MKALIVDGEELFRLSMKEVVSVAASFSEVIEAGSETEFLAKTATYDDIDLVVMHPTSLSHNNRIAGIEEGKNCLRLVRRLYPDASVVIITDTPSMAATWQGATTVGRGAKVSLMINKIRYALNMPAVSAVKSHAAPATPDIRSFVKHSEGKYAAAEGGYVDLGRLSFRQRQILAMAADGLPNKEIAARLGIAEGTVKAHMHAIFKVLDVSNRTQAVIKYGAINQQVAAAESMVHSAV